MRPKALDVFPGSDTWRMTLALSRARLQDFTALLQSGVAVPFRTGCSVLSFLTDQLGIDPLEVETRITTVFLDGKVVDTFDEAILQDGSRLALSAALPGLVGATLRRSGAYAAMRADITWAPCPPEHAAPASAAGIVHVKLFNLLIDALGPALLRHGVVLDAADMPEPLGPLRELVRPPGAGGRVFLRASFG